MHGSAPSRVAFGLEPRRLERGKRARWRTASLDWTGPRASTTPPSCHVTSAIARSLRPCRTIRTVAASRGREARDHGNRGLRPAACQRPAFSRVYPVSELAGADSTAQPPVNDTPASGSRPRLFPQSAWDASVDPANGPPAAGSRLCSSPPARSCRFSRSRQRPDSRRVPTVSELAGSEVPP
jgi:hypothetical protein